MPFIEAYIQPLNLIMLHICSITLPGSFFLFLLFFSFCLLLLLLLLLSLLLLLLLQVQLNSDTESTPVLKQMTESSSTDLKGALREAVADKILVKQVEDYVGKGNRDVLMLTKSEGYQHFMLQLKSTKNWKKIRTTLKFWRRFLVVQMTILKVLGKKFSSKQKVCSFQNYLPLSKINEEAGSRTKWQINLHCIQKSLVLEEEQEKT